MSFRCQEVGCGKIIRTVGDVRACERCREAGRVTARTGGLPEHHADDDPLTPLVLGVLLGSAFSHHEDHGVAAPEPFTGGGGESAGGGAGGSFDDSPAEPSSSPTESSSSDSGGSGGGDNS